MVLKEKKDNETMFLFSKREYFVYPPQISRMQI